MRGLPINQEGRKSELSPRGLGAEKREPLGRKVEQTDLGLFTHSQTLRWVPDSAEGGYHSFFFFKKQFIFFLTEKV